MIKVCDVLTALFDAAPEYMKMEWDNVGLLCGRRTAAVRRVMVALDPMPDVFAEVKARGCELIVTHHPLILQPVRAVNDASFTGENLLWLIENGIAAINLHTNPDCAPGGVNDILAQTLGLSDITVLDPVGQDAQGREALPRRRRPDSGAQGRAALTGRQGGRSRGVTGRQGDP